MKLHNGDEGTHIIQFNNYPSPCEATKLFYVLLYYLSAVLVASMHNQIFSYYKYPPPQEFLFLKSVIARPFQV